MNLKIQFTAPALRTTWNQVGRQSTHTRPQQNAYADPGEQKERPFCPGR